MTARDGLTGGIGGVVAAKDPAAMFNVPPGVSAEAYVEGPVFCGEGVVVTHGEDSFSRKIAPAAPPNLHTYRAYLQRSLMPSATGVLEFIQLKAESATLAARAALAVSGAMAVVEVERIEQAAA